jgi:polyphenol oxidase
MKLVLPDFEDRTGRVSHGFFGRVGGVSTGLYDSLNCGQGSRDAPDAVAENRRRVANEFGVNPEKLMSQHQSHTALCIDMDADLITRHKADAMVTTRSGVLLGVLAADCGPVLFRGETATGTPVIGAAHAGWGGALSGVLESTVMMMCDKGAQLASIHAAVGPCIGRASYEVSVGFETPFLERDADDEMFFQGANHPEKLHFDLAGYIARRLKNCGVGRISLSDIDTYTHENTYFSYRRSCHAQEPDYGRQISTIMID